MMRVPSGLPAAAAALAVAVLATRPQHAGPQHVVLQHVGPEHVGPSRAAAQDPKPASQRPAPSAPVLQRARELAGLAPEHGRIQRLAGTWDVALQTHAAAGAEVQQGRGTVVGQAILGGRYVVLSHRLELAGDTLEAVQIVGFDTLRGDYTASWRDDRSTWEVACRGAPDTQQPDVLQLVGTLADARDPDGRPFRFELDLRDERLVTWRVWDRRADGEEFLLQDARWTRR